MKTEVPYYDIRLNEIKEFDLVSIYYMMGIPGRASNTLYKWIRLKELSGMMKYVAVDLRGQSGIFIPLSLMANKNRVVTTLDIIQAAEDDNPRESTETA